MAQAKVINITTRREAETVFSPIEYQASGALRMADMLVDLLEAYLSDKGSHKALFGGRDDCFYLSPDSIKNLFFIAYDLKDRTRATHEAVEALI